MTSCSENALRSRLSRLALICGLSLGSSSVSASGMGLGERYIPFEPTNHAASTIVGPIIANREKIRLDNGRIMHLTDAGLPPIEDWPSVTGLPSKSYVHLVSGDLGEMRFGMDLCIGGYPTYAVTRVSASRHYIYYDIALFRGDEPPTSASDEDLCGGFYGYRVERSEAEDRIVAIPASVAELASVSTDQQ